MDGNLDYELLARSVTEVITRFEALRTYFPRGVDAVGQRIASSAAAVVTHQSLRGQPMAMAETSAVSWATSLLSEPFVLDSPPLVRAGLAEVSTSRSLFAVSISHLVCDGWSANLVLDAIFSAYASGGTIAIAEGPEWSEYLKRTTIASKAIDTLPPVLLRRDGALHSVRWPGATVGPPNLSTTNGLVCAEAMIEDFATRCKELRSSLNAGLLAGLAILIARETGDVRPQIRIPTANRSHFADLYTVGYVTNQVLITVDVGRCHTLSDCVRQTQSHIVAGLERAHIPFWGMAARADPTQFGDLSDHRPVQLDYIQPWGPSSSPTRMADVTMTSAPLSVNSYLRQTTFTMHPRASRLTMELHYEDDLYPPPAASRLLHAFGGITAEIAATPHLSPL
jgi:hypothetical protein